ncbi:uncharacterized protein JCM15063_003588 [Sporobolomyces koalae]|uniref:uncharacterized protein n=1 Tax=Sporobolomyces koalae TaxID=500713 RepID=UPI00316DA46D
MGKDRLDRIGARSGDSGKLSGSDKNRIDKAQQERGDVLRERREQRELEDLKSEVAQLNRQLEEERDKVSKDRSNPQSAERKAHEKEVASLEKQLKRAQEEVATLLACRDEYKKQVASLQQEMASNTVVISLKEELKASKSYATDAEIQLKTLEEEAGTYRARCTHLETVQLERAEEDAKSTERIKEQKRLEKRLEKAEQEHAKFDVRYHDLLKLCESTQARVDYLEPELARLQGDKLILTEEKDQAVARVDEFSSIFASLLGRPIVKEIGKGQLAKVKEELEQKLRDAKLQSEENKKMFSTLSKSSISADHERYDQLVSNLRMTEDDVSLLLASGPDWPPLGDHKDEPQSQTQGDKERALQAEIVRLNQLVVGREDRDKAVQSAHEEELKRQVDETSKQRQEFETRDIEIRKLTSDQETIEAEFALERMKKDEIIVTLEQKLAAVEDAARSSVNGNGMSGLSHPLCGPRLTCFKVGDRSPVHSHAFSASGVSQASRYAMKSMADTIAALNEEVARLRNDKTTLLIQLAGAADF